MKKIGILTSGGDAPGMNGAIRAVVRTAIYNNIQVVGIKKGYDGLIDKDFYPMNVSSVGDILQRGGTILRTSRSTRFLEEAGREMAVANMRDEGIDSLVVIGGEGSLRGAALLARLGIQVVVIPGTIDNDMGYTDFTIGFDTAVNTVLAAISNIRDTASSHDRATLIEVMGRRNGDIALYAGLAGGADSILIPEVPVDLEVVSQKLEEGKNRGKLHNIIIKAEGVPASNEEIISSIYKKTGQETNLVVMSYLQRGGSPSGRDRMLGSLMGFEAVTNIIKSLDSVAIGIRGNEIITMNLIEGSKITKEADLAKLKVIEILSK